VKQGVTPTAQGILGGPAEFADIREMPVPKPIQRRMLTERGSIDLREGCKERVIQEFAQMLHDIFSTPALDAELCWPRSHDHLFIATSANPAIETDHAGSNGLAPAELIDGDACPCFEDVGTASIGERRNEVDFVALPRAGAKFRSEKADRSIKRTGLIENLDYKRCACVDYSCGSANEGTVIDRLAMKCIEA
jgi:hypothetical protein